jgi:hypothetical protein
MRQEIGLAAYLDALDTSYPARVSVGTATAAHAIDSMVTQYTLAK